jgi:Ca2+-transporting ATPase
MLAAQFKDCMVIVLICAAVVSAATGSFTEAFSILAVVLLNALLGFAQAYRTEKALDALKKLSAPTARVVRGGLELRIPSAEVVPGDIIRLEAGERVPADAVILSSNAPSLDESMLTGESLPVFKKEKSRVYMGSMLLSGSLIAKADKTGMSAEMGKIAGMLDADLGEETTPLQQKLKKMGGVIVACCLIICAGVTLTGLVRGEPWLSMLLLGISLAVAAIPEGLPAVVTVALAIGVTRMSRRNAIVRRLPCVETLGSATVICSDKTGTLTQNRMTCRYLYTALGRVSCDRLTPGPLESALLWSGALCTNAKKTATGFLGDPTETAIVSLADAVGVSPTLTRVKENPFDSDRKLMSVITSDGAAHIKGAPDRLLPRCTHILTAGGVQMLDSSRLSQIFSEVACLASEGLRVLAVARKESAGQNPESGATFLGLIAMEDPPRAEAAESVRACRRAGIRPVMITGDHRDTALAIAKRLGIARPGDRAVTGDELDRMGEQGLASIIGSVSVFARVSPRHKLWIVRAFRKKGDVVAMTGDGVNDAPAVRAADIGVSMGKSGTDVTREASDMILSDDDFSTIASAVREGRTIYANIRKFMRYMLSSNLGEVLVMFLCSLLLLPLPLSPIHILLVNLTTDGLPAMALGLDRADRDVMRRPPRKKNEGIFAHGLGFKILIRGAIIGAVTVGVFVYTLKASGNLTLARTAAFVTLAFSQLVFVFECRSERGGMFSRRLFDNIYLSAAVLISICILAVSVYSPLFSELFGLAPLPPRFALLCVFVSIASAALSSVLSFIRVKKKP